MKQETGTKRVLIQVSPATHAAWKSAAASKGMSMSGLANALLTAWLSKNGDKR